MSTNKESTIDDELKSLDNAAWSKIGVAGVVAFTATFILTARSDVGYRIVDGGVNALIACITFFCGYILARTIIKLAGEEEVTDKEKAAKELLGRFFASCLIAMVVVFLLTLIFSNIVGWSATVVGVAAVIAGAAYYFRIFWNVAGTSSEV